MPQGSNIDLFDRRTQALRRPYETAPITSNGLLDISQASLADAEVVFRPLHIGVSLFEDWKLRMNKSLLQS
jgi:hypothetical protein